MTIDGTNIDKPKLANLAKPTGHTTVNGILIDWQKLTAAAEERYGELAKGVVISVSGYRNARGEMVPDYDTVRIEKP